MRNFVPAVFAGRSALMTGERLTEIRRLLLSYRPTDDPNRQGELLTAAQDLFDMARRVLSLEVGLRRLLAEWEEGAVRRETDWSRGLGERCWVAATHLRACAVDLRTVLGTVEAIESGASPDA